MDKFWVDDSFPDDVTDWNKKNRTVVLKKKLLLSGNIILTSQFRRECLDKNSGFALVDRLFRRQRRKVENKFVKVLYVVNQQSEWLDAIAAEDYFIYNFSVYKVMVYNKIFTAELVLEMHNYSSVQVL